jgi:hypothetical protein
MLLLSLRSICCVLLKIGQTRSHLQRRSYQPKGSIGKDFGRQELRIYGTPEECTSGKESKGVLQASGGDRLDQGNGGRYGSEECIRVARLQV